MALNISDLYNTHQENIEASAAVETVTGPMGGQTGQTEETSTTEKACFDSFIKKIPSLSFERLAALHKEQSKGLELDPFKMSRWNEDFKNYSDEPVKFKGLTVLAARTGGGKTLVLTSFLNLLLATKPDYHAVLFSLEESESAIFTRTAPGFFFLKDQEKGISQSFYKSALEDALEGKESEWAQLAAARINSDDGADFFNRLHIITKQNFKETLAAMKEEGERQENKNFAERIVVGGADEVQNIVDIITAFRNKYGDKVVFFADFIQKMHNFETHERDSWKEVKAVMNKLTEAAESGAIIFTTAQMTREAAKEGGKQKTPTTEFYDVIPEHLREGADIEQAAELILYLKIDNGYMNMRTLKHRGGSQLSASAQFLNRFSFVNLSSMEEAQLKNPEHEASGTGTAPVLFGSEKKTTTTGKTVLSGDANIAKQAFIDVASRSSLTEDGVIKISEKEWQEKYFAQNTGKSNEDFKKYRDELEKEKLISRQGRKFWIANKDLDAQIRPLINISIV